MTTLLCSVSCQKRRPGTRAITKYLPAVCMAKPGQFHAKCIKACNVDYDVSYEFKINGYSGQAQIDPERSMDNYDSLHFYSYVF